MWLSQGYHCPTREMGVTAPDGKETRVLDVLDVSEYWFTLSLSINTGEGSIRIVLMIELVRLVCMIGGVRVCETVCICSYPEFMACSTIPSLVIAAVCIRTNDCVSYQLG